MTVHPYFTDGDVGKKKVVVTERYLNQAGIKTIQAEPYALDESKLWRSRAQGTPDVLIAAANERNVREVIENDFPPVQIYGTTGQNWQATMIRHVPLHDPCSVCLFPATNHEPTMCATGGVTVERENGKNKSMQRCHFCPLLPAQWPLPKSSNSACLDIPSRRTGLS